MVFSTVIPRILKSEDILTSISPTLITSLEGLAKFDPNIYQSGAFKVVR